MDESRLPATTPLTMQAWSLILDVAPTMLASRLFSVASEEQAITIMVKGYELGFGLGASLEFIQVVEGKLRLSPRGALALIQQHPAFAGMTVEEKPDSCRVTMKRKNGFEHTVEFTTDDAKRAGLFNLGGGQEKCLASTLRWQAIALCADAVFPDALGGMRCTDEVEADLTPDSEAVKVECIAKPPSPAPTWTEPCQESPRSPDHVRALIRLRAGWLRDGARLVRNVGSKAEPIHADTRQRVASLLIEALQFDGATERDLADNAKALLKWLFGVEASAKLTEAEGKAIEYAWGKPGGGLGECARMEIKNALAEALEAQS